MQFFPYCTNLNAQNLKLKFRSIQRDSEFVEPNRLKFRFLLTGETYFTGEIFLTGETFLKGEIFLTGENFLTGESMALAAHSGTKSCLATINSTFKRFFA